MLTCYRTVDGLPIDPLAVGIPNREMLNGEIGAGVGSSVNSAAMQSPVSGVIRIPFRECPVA
jgi:hypothetical protein